MSASQIRYWTIFLLLTVTGQITKNSAQELRDIGVIEISAPVGTLRLGDTVTPQASIANFGNFPERYFDVRFRIGDLYDHTITVNATLLPESVITMSFPIWIATFGSHHVACSTMLSVDSNPENDLYLSNVQVTTETFLRLGPNQICSLKFGENKVFLLYVDFVHHLGSTIELQTSRVPSGWSVRLLDSTGTTPLTDTDTDGLPDLGFIIPGRRVYFNLFVSSPSQPSGDPSVMDSVKLIIKAFPAIDTMLKAQAELKIILVPILTVHNYPNPLYDHTTFLISLPEPGRVTLTIFNRAGEKIYTLLENRILDRGVHLFEWRATEENQHPVAPGLYYYLFEFKTGSRTIKLTKKLLINRN